MKQISQISEECQWRREQQNLCNSDGAIDQNFDLKTHENDDYSDQELFVDEDEGDDNESSDEDAPPENQSQVPQNAVYWSSKQREIDVENFSFRLGPTKNLGDIATAKDFFNQFLDDDYLDQIVRYAIAYARSKGDNNLARKHSEIA